jgi:hypothetical protein
VRPPLPSRVSGSAAEQPWSARIKMGKKKLRVDPTRTSSSLGLARRTSASFAGARYRLSNRRSEIFSNWLDH